MRPSSNHAIVRLVRAASAAAVAVVAASTFDVRAGAAQQSVARTAMHAEGSVLPSIVPPVDVTSTKAFAVLNHHCARCHQAGSLKGAAIPGGQFANILDLDAVAAEPSLVRPGQPDLSKLYTVMLQRHFPVEGYANGEEPSHLEIEAVRAWIEDAGVKHKPCSIPPVTDEQANAAVSAWLDQVGAAVARTTRFVSLVPLFNACASEGDMAGYRQGVQKMLLSLSWAGEPARIETVGDSLAILAVRLDHLGWVDAHWERLAKASPAGSRPLAAKAVREATGSAYPILRGDWMASAALEAPLYYELLGLPPTRSELIGMAFGDKAGPRGKRLRAAIRTSGATRANRVLERWRGERGAVWQAYDFMPGGEGQDVFDHPLGPGPAANPNHGQPFKPAGTRLLFALPNGWTGFAVHDADGKLAGRVAPGIDRDVPPGAHGAGVGRGCIGCHATGAITVQDDMRSHASSDKLGNRDVREAALAEYAAQGDLAAAFEDDKYLARRALVRAGVDPDLTLAGLDPVEALARRYRLDVTAERLAGELGIAVAALSSRLDGLQGSARPLGLRLAQGALTRSEAEIVKLALGELPGGAAPVETATVPNAGAPRLRLALWSEKSVYRRGDLAAVYAQPSADCNLTLISIDPAGKATVLFPNDFDQDNAVAGGRIVRMPAVDAPYQLRFKDKGRETIVGVCQAGPRVLPGIEHDYERQRFTLLGNWKNFLNVSLIEASEQRRNPERYERTNGSARRGRRGEPDRAPRASGRLEAEARAAISIAVE